MSRIPVLLSCVLLMTAGAPDVNARDINPFALFGAAQQLANTITRENRKAAARERKREAAAREQARRAELSRTKKGRQQLAREEAQRRAERERNNRMIAGFLAGALASDGGSSSNSRRSGPPDDFDPNASSRSAAPSASAPSAPPINSFYSGCHGGAFYGC